MELLTRRGVTGSEVGLGRNKARRTDRQMELKSEFCELISMTRKTMKQRQSLHFSGIYENDPDDELISKAISSIPATGTSFARDSATKRRCLVDDPLCFQS